MNNDDLAERLRLPSFSKRDRLAGADRIDELVATCEELEAKLAECEARLEKALEALEDISGNGSAAGRNPQLMSDKARTTLAELSSPMKGKDQ